MKQFYLIVFAILTFAACYKETPDPERSMEHPDWYILQGPERAEIHSVYGDIDGILLISDRFRIFYSTDKGKTWTKTGYESGSGIAGFAKSNDTLFVLDGEITSGADPGNRYAYGPKYFSVNGGLTWEKLRQTSATPEIRTPLNFAFSGNGIRFDIERLIHPSGVVEDLGIRTENGRKLSLPMRHVLNQVYFDENSRLYVAGSFPFCENGGSLEFCDKADPRAILYISKKPVYR